MCYGIRADAKKDVTKLTSVKEGMVTPREDVSARQTKTASSMPGAGAVAMPHAPFSKDKGGIWQTDEFAMKSSADTQELEKTD